MQIATTIEAAASGAGMVLLLGGTVFGLGRFRGVMDANTKATEKLTETFEKHADKLSDHETRITVLEKA